MDVRSEQQDLETMKGPHTALEMHQLSEDKDRNALLRLGKKPVLKVCSPYSLNPRAFSSEVSYNHESHVQAKGHSEFSNSDTDILPSICRETSDSCPF